GWLDGKGLIEQPSAAALLGGSVLESLVHYLVHVVALEGQPFDENFHVQDGCASHLFGRFLIRQLLDCPFTGAVRAGDKRFVTSNLAMDALESLLLELAQQGLLGLGLIIR